VSTATATRATLPLAAVIADLRGQRADASGQEARNLVGDLRWALIDQARALQADEHARAVAEEMAAEGDQEAAEALRLAHELEPLPPPSLVRGNFGCGLAISGGAVPPGLVAVLAAHRADGLPFGTSWVLALSELRADRGPGRAILEATRPAWRASYYRATAPAGFNVVAWGDDK